jgi:parallel beta-helix repeat protein
MASNWGNFFVFGEVLGDFVNNVSASNLVDGKPVYYLMSKSNIVISPQTCPEGVGYLGLVNCTNVTVQGLTLTKNGQGLLLAFTNDSKITSNNVTGNSYDGIFIISSSGNTLFRNRVTGNSGANGIDLYYSSGSTLSGNNVTANGGDGISFYHSSGSTLSGNNVTANGVDGIFLESFSGSTLSGNNVTANGVDGIVLYHSSGNTFFHNNFVGNAQQVSSDGSPNTWDNGYPSGGNYWSDYSGVDHKSGPGQNVTGSDGIGDTPYGIDANNIDRYPLMGPFHTFGVGTWSGVTYSVDTVSNSTITNLSFSAATKSLSFNVTGPNGTIGFCRLAIPLSLMSGEWIVIVNGTSISYSTIPYGNYTYIYFTYHHSTETVKITSTSVIPEFRPSMLLPLFMIITLIGAIIFKRKRKVRK